MKKWALILFTIFTQSAVGAFAILAAHRATMSAVDSLPVLPVLLTISALMLVSLAISLAHLGSPANAPWAIANLGSSWLSREIFTSLLFTGAVLATTVLEWRDVDVETLRIAMKWFGIGVGFLFIFSMSRVYMVCTIYVWNSLLTPAAFFITVFLLGGMLIVILAERINRMMVMGQLGMIAAGLLVFTLWAVRVSTALRRLGDHLWLVFARIGFILAGGGLLAAILADHGSPDTLARAALVCLFLGEVIGRNLFYAVQELSEHDQVRPAH